MANECIPKYEPGEDLTAYANVALTGKRCVALVADKRGVEAVSDDVTGGNIVVGNPALGGRIVGVAGYDCPATKLVKVVRGPGKVVPIRCSIAVVFDNEVEAAADGTVIPRDAAARPAGKAIGRAFRSAAINTDALIELYGSPVAS